MILRREDQIMLCSKAIRTIQVVDFQYSGTFLSVVGLD